MQYNVEQKDRRWMDSKTESVHSSFMSKTNAVLQQIAIIGCIVAQIVPFLLRQRGGGIGR